MSERRPVQVGIVENFSPAATASFLRNAGTGAVGVDVASAFVTSAGLGLLHYRLK